MAIVEITIKERIASAPADIVLVCNNPTDTLCFNFDAEWDSHTEKVARFEWGGSFVDVPFVGYSVNAPEITNTLYVNVGVYSDDIASTPVKLQCKRSVLCLGGKERIPSDNTNFDQFIGCLASKANALIQTESGSFVSIYPEENSRIKVTTDGTTVTRYGKNLIPYPYEVSSKTVAGVTITDNGDGSLTFNGTSTDGGWYHLFAADLDICDAYMATNASTAYTDVGLMMSVSDVAVPGLSLIYYGTTNKRLTIKITAANVTFDNVTIYPMIEVGNGKTEWEPYQAESFDVADGATSIPAISGLNNISSDGTTVEVTYNKSIARTVEELTNAIISLGGNV